MAGEDRSVVREQEVLERLGGDREFLLELLRDFVQVALEETEKLRAALDSGDIDAAVMAAHSMKGAAANLSAERLFDVTRSIEGKCSEGDVDGAADLMTDLGSELDRLVEHIQKIEPSDPGSLRGD